MQEMNDKFDILEGKLAYDIELKFKSERLKMGIFNPNPDRLAIDPFSNIKRMLLLKADKMELEKLFSLKSDKNEMNNIIQLQKIMSRQFKYILVLFIEFINMQKIRADDTKGSFETRLKELMQ